MNDLSFIIQSDDIRPDRLYNTIDIISSILDYSTAINIIILNKCIDPGHIKELTSREERWPDNILIINTDNNVGSEESIDICLEYVNSYCYIPVKEPIDLLCPELFDKLIPCTETCNNDRYKYIKDKYTYISLSVGDQAFPYDQSVEMPFLYDYRNNAGSVDPHYFFQDIYVASKVREMGITHIFDIGSRLDGYISHLLSMDISVTMIDIRPLPVKINNLAFMEGDATNLSNIKPGTITILSCLHALEHFGLGRYGDTIDPDGWRKALIAYKRIVALNGYLFISVPVGKLETLVFNAHRIFNPLTIVSNLVPTFSLMEFTLFHDCQRTTFDFSRASSTEDMSGIFNDISSNLLGNNDCGIFVFKKM